MHGDHQLLRCFVCLIQPIQLDIRFPTIKSAPQTANFSLTVTSVANS
jgi:hypothetical protein